MLFSHLLLAKPITGLGKRWLHCLYTEGKAGSLSDPPDTIDCNSLIQRACTECILQTSEEWWGGLRSCVLLGLGQWAPSSWAVPSWARYSISLSLSTFFGAVRVVIASQHCCVVEITLTKHQTLPAFLAFFLKHVTMLCPNREDLFHFLLQLLQLQNESVGSEVSSERPSVVCADFSEIGFSFSFHFPSSYQL